MKPRIGISCELGVYKTFFSNSIKQLPIFMMRLLRRAGYEAYLLPQEGAVLEPAIVAEADVCLESEQIFDAVIEVSRAFTDEELDLHQGRGAQIIKVIGSNQAMFAIEAGIGGDQSAAEVYDPERLKKFTDVWVVQGYEIYKSWAEMLYQCDVKIIPQMWEPLFVPEVFCPKITDDKKIAIMEPNNSVDRTCLYPLQAVSFTPMLDHYVSRVMVTNIEDQVQAGKAAAFFTSHLANPDPETSPRLDLIGRQVGPQFLVDEGVSLVVSHSLCSDMKYLHFEALYGGWPLLHTSPTLKKAGLGYHWPRCDAKHGGVQITKALVELSNETAATTRQKFIIFMMDQLQQTDIFEELL